MNEGCPHPLSVSGQARIHTEPSTEPGYVRFSVLQGERLVVGFDVSAATLAAIAKQAKQESKHR